MKSEGIWNKVTKVDGGWKTTKRNGKHCYRLDDIQHFSHGNCFDGFLYTNWKKNSSCGKNISCYDVPAALNHAESSIVPSRNSLYVQPNSGNPISNNRSHKYLLSINLWSFRYLLLAFIYFSSCDAFCPPSCDCDEVTLNVNCSGGNLDVIPHLLNPSIKHLNLSHNNVNTILEGIIFYHQLESLDLSHNEIITIGSENFADQRLLLSLTLSNNKISRIQNKAFVGLPKLTALDLSTNYIELVEQNAFNLLPSLSKLDLSNNRLHNMTSHVFLKLKQLRVLSLCKNRLVQISSALITPLKDLQFLDISSNELTVVQDNIFKTLKHLSHLLLQNNRIETLSSKAFNGLHSLSLLDIQQNSFEEVPSKQFTSVKNLKELNLSFNPFKTVEKGSFESLTNLNNLYISHCDNLETVQPGAFKNLSKLILLDMSFNPNLTILDKDIFIPLVNVRKLVLRNNALQTLHGSILKNKYLKYLDIRENKLECNCSLKWLHEAIQNKSFVTKIEDVICSSPESLKRTSILNLTEYDLECHNHLLIVCICLAISIASTIIASTFGILYYKHCRKMKSLVHDNWPEKITTTWRDPAYEKRLEDDNYSFHSLHGIQHIPVTVI